MRVSSEVEDYHPQKVRSDTIMGFLEYIVGYKRYRDNVRNQKKRQREKERIQ